MANHRKQYCPKGHDTLLVGRLNGGCMTCRRDASRRRTVEQPVAVHAAIKRWSLANKDRRRDTALRRLYGISLTEYSTRVTSQNGLCLICEVKSALVVDHCHRSGKIRGLLCGTCNRAMGLFQDDPAKLRSAVSYLENAI